MIPQWPTLRNPASRRSFGASLAASLLAASGLFFLVARAKTAGAGEPKPLVIAVVTADWAPSLRIAWLDPYADLSGRRVVAVSDASYDRLRAMVTTGRVEWNVVELTPAWQAAARRDDLLENLDFSAMDHSQLIVGADLVTETSVADVVWSHVMFFNTQQFPDGRQPQNWAGMWDINGFPGKRSLPKAANSGVLEAALMADGVAAAQLYPLDIDRALRRLGQIKNQVIWWSTAAESQQIMVASQAVLGLVEDRQALSAIEQGAQISIQYNQSLMTWRSLAIPKGAPDRAASLAFLRYVLTPDAQAAMATADTYGPVTPAAFDQLPPHRAAMLSGGPQQQSLARWVDERWWSENLTHVAAKYDAWRAS